MNPTIEIRKTHKKLTQILKRMSIRGKLKIEKEHQYYNENENDFNITFWCRNRYEILNYFSNNFVVGHTKENKLQPAKICNTCYSFLQGPLLISLWLT